MYSRNYVSQTDLRNLVVYSDYVVVLDVGNEEALNRAIYFFVHYFKFIVFMKKKTC